MWTECLAIAVDKSKHFGQLGTDSTTCVNTVRCQPCNINPPDGLWTLELWMLLGSFIYQTTSPPSVAFPVVVISQTQEQVSTIPKNAWYVNGPTGGALGLECCCFRTCHWHYMFWGRRNQSRWWAELWAVLQFTVTHDLWLLVVYTDSWAVHWGLTVYGTMTSGKMVYTEITWGAVMWQQIWGQL